MIIELSLLPPSIAKQIKQVAYGETIQFAENGQVFANVNAINYNAFLSFYANTPFEVADIDLPEFDRSLSKFDDPFEDD